MQTYLLHEIIYDSYSTTKLLSDCTRKPLVEHPKAIGTPLLARIEALAKYLEYPTTKIYVYDSKKYDIIFVDETSWFGTNAIHLSSKFFVIIFFVTHLHNL